MSTIIQNLLVQENVSEVDPQPSSSSKNVLDYSLMGEPHRRVAFLLKKIDDPILREHISFSVLKDYLISSNIIKGDRSVDFFGDKFLEVENDSDEFKSVCGEWLNQLIKKDGSVKSIINNWTYQLFDVNVPFIAFGSQSDIQENKVGSLLEIFGLFEKKAPTNSGSRFGYTRAVTNEGLTIFRMVREKSMPVKEKEKGGGWFSNNKMFNKKDSHNVTSVGDPVDTTIGNQNKVSKKYYIFVLVIVIILAAIFLIKQLL